MGFGGGCQSGRRFHFDFTSPTTGQCCAPVMETYTYLAFLAFTPAATWFLRSAITWPGNRIFFDYLALLVHVRSPDFLY